ncbi:hypothetical protein [Limnohabitans sp. T6-5]|uniref:hypothetical protein n=1 Tax=Limnohabitans sp. T6-5 TaxID=1100724 RepID=UPI000D33B999|nr:hypothetical protein [Limnohabitans sp. T6-5]
MNKRNLLRCNLEATWTNTIQLYYNSQLINSEHSLQVYFCMELLKQFQSKNLQRRIFIEPNIQTSCGIRFPDVVICNSQEIICIVELKYAPRGRPSIGKDLETLSFSTSEPFEIKNERYHGPSREDLKKYTVADDAIICWAGIYTGERINLTSIPKEQKFEDRFLQMDGLTNQDDDPEIWINERRILAECAN